MRELPLTLSDPTHIESILTYKQLFVPQNSVWSRIVGAVE